MVVDMSGVDPYITYHKLSVYEDRRPIAQRKRRMGEERKVAAEMEVDKLLKAEFIKRCTIQPSNPMLFWYRNQMESGECVWITQT